MSETRLTKDCPFVVSYVEAMLRFTTDFMDESSDNALDWLYGSDHISEEMWVEVLDDCSGFLGEVGHLIKEEDIYQAGKDFWLTKQGIFNGFREGNWEHGAKLSEWAKTFRGNDPMPRDDGFLYF